MNVFRYKQENLLDRYSELMQRYEDMKFNDREGSSIEAEFSYVSEELARRRPLVVDHHGCLHNARKGVRIDTLAQRQRKEFYRAPRPMVDGREINPATELVPKLLYPKEVVIDGSKMDGKVWFDEFTKDMYPKPEGGVWEADFNRIPKREWSDLIESGEAPDLRNRVKWVLDQNGVGSCASEGLGGADALKRIYSGLFPSGNNQDTAPNPWFVYHTVSGGYDGGSSLNDNVAFYQKYGCARQAVWPRSKGWRRKPSDEAYEDGLHYKPLDILAFPVRDVELGGTCILNGYPVYTGYSGHAWFWIWLASTSSLIWMNSWGRSWGSSGMGTLSFSRLMYGCYAVLSSTASMLEY